MDEITWNRVFVRSAIILILFVLIQFIFEITSATPYLLPEYRFPHSRDEALAWIGLPLFVSLFVILSIFIRFIPERTMIYIFVKSLFISLIIVIVIQIPVSELTWSRDFPLDPYLIIFIDSFIASLMMYAITGYMMNSMRKSTIKITR